MDWSPTATHHIINRPPSSTSADGSIEILQKGRTVFWAHIERPLLGRPRLRLTTAKVDGERPVASAKLQPGRGGSHVVLGNPKTDPKDRCVHARVERKGTGAGGWKFDFEGRTYTWKLKLDDSGKFTSNTGMFELTDVGDPHRPLAAYHQCNRDGVSANENVETGRLDFMEELGAELQLLCLTAILGMEQNHGVRQACGSGLMGLGGMGTM